MRARVWKVLCLMIKRRGTRAVQVGSVQVGGGAPISIQSMTNSPTADVAATLSQIEPLYQAGCEIIRLAVPDAVAAAVLPEIVRHCPMPLIADIHFDYRLALAALDAGVACLRINPGNIGKQDKVKAVVTAAAERKVPIRIGVNGGSLEKSLLERVHSGELTLAEAMTESALGHIRILEDLDFQDIKISLKASDVVTTVEAYRALAGRCDYPFHVGVTEAGTIKTGTIKSAAGIGILLMDGLCDTIRVSLTGSSLEEVRVARSLLRSMGERKDGPELISCPTCGRVSIDLFSLVDEVERMLENVRAPIRVAVMGCEVNGPGEAREADIGIAGGGGKGIIFRKGEIVLRCKESEILDAFRKELNVVLGDMEKQ